MLRRIRAQLEMDSHPNRQLQHDWSVSGETGFVFEVVDLVDEPDSPTDEITGDLVALNELWQEYENVPYGVVELKMPAQMFPQGHPYSWPVIGYIPDLEATSLEDVSSFFKRFYAPSNAVLTLVGDIEPEQELRRIERFFGEIPRGPEIEPVTAPPSERTRSSLAA